MMSPKHIMVDGVKFKILHNYLHRGQAPRIVLDHKENGSNVCVQFDNTQEALLELEHPIWINPVKGYRSSQNGNECVSLLFLFD